MNSSTPMMDLEQMTKRINLESMVQIRRYFHQRPELSFEELETSNDIIRRLCSYGLEVISGIGGTGIVATLDGGGLGPTIAFRCDMDALPIQDGKQVEYRSLQKGKMHACGHDGHMSILLETARILSEHKEKLNGRVKFIFQHAEELVPGGARDILESGYIDDVDFIFGLHLWTGFDTWKIGLRSGPVMASSDHFDIRLTGKGGHGGLPHQAVDLISMSSHLIQQFQEIVSRRMDPVQSNLISIGSIHGGDTYNVLPGEVLLKGTVRCFDHSCRDKIQELMKETLHHICALYGADYEFAYHKGYSPVINSSQQTEWASKVFEGLFPEETVFEMDPLMAGEDFAYYLEKIPGCFFFVGCRNEEKNSAFPHHHHLFDIDENALYIGAKAYLGLIHYLLCKE